MAEAGGPAGALVALRARLGLARWLTALAFALLLVRLVRLQIVRGEEMRDKGRRNVVSQIELPHDRGIVFDRQGRTLVDNQASLALQITPAFLGPAAKAQATLALLSRLLGAPPETSERWRHTLADVQGLGRFQPYTVWRDLTPLQVEAVDTARSLLLLDGVDIIEGRRRVFHYGSLAAHTLGYVGEIDGTSLELERQRGNPGNYQAGELWGKDGLERVLEPSLRGVNGFEKIVVDAKGRRQRADQLAALLGEHRRQEPIPGHNVYLTLDLALQQVAEAAFLRRGRAGSVVLLDAKTFDVLVLASLPAYDANLMSGTLRTEDKAQLDRDVLKPWLNRSIAGQYAPGSTFKVVTALAALRHEPNVAHELIACPGTYRLGSHTWRCWRDAGHGPLSLARALKHSCDVFFYTLGGRLGLDALAEAAHALGFGERTGLVLRGEQPGLVPSEAYHRRADAARGGYVRGMAINSSIGQGSLTVTPLQLAVAYAALARGQRPQTPALLGRIESADRRRRQLTLSDDAERLLERTLGEPPTVVSAHVPAPFAPLDVEPKALEAVRAGLVAALAERGGTAYRFRSQKVSMAGKTGTTQVVKLAKERHTGERADYFARDHAWFVAYAPVEDPAVVVAVLNEHGGHGGSAAAPIAVEVLDAWADAYLPSNAVRTAPAARARAAARAASEPR